MSESFVDLEYRGLPLGQRVKLTQIYPASGYLEMPVPMPVGSTIVLTTDDGLAIEARVTSIHEQIAGSERAPGMAVAPRLADDRASTWWGARAVEPPAPKSTKPASAPPIMVRPRSHTRPEPPSEAAFADALATAQRAPSTVAEPPGGKTTVMPAVTVPETKTVVIPPASAAADADAGKTKVMAAVDQELLESLTRKSGEFEALVGGDDHAVVDDGRETTVMAAVDPSALGLDAGTSGTMATATDDPQPGKKKKRKRR